MNADENRKQEADKMYGDFWPDRSACAAGNLPVGHGKYGTCRGYGSRQPGPGGGQRIQLPH